jgi:DNA-binding transcriptional LysR family regulator
VLANVPGATWLREHAMGAQVVMRGTSILAVVSAVVAGIGASVIPCFLASAEATLRRLTPKVLGGRDLFLLVHPDMRKVPRVRVTHEFLVEIVEAEAATLRGDATARPARKRRA